MICKNCGCTVEEGKTYCLNCGAQVPPAPTPDYSDYNMAGDPAPKTSTYEVTQQSVVQPGKGLAIAGMIIGIVGFALGIFSVTCIYGALYTSLFALCTSIVGLILSCKAVKNAKAYGEKDKKATLGRVFSIIGLILSVVGMSIYLFYLFGASLVGVFAALAES